RYIDDVGLDPALLVVAEAPIAQHPRAEILDHDVADRDQPLDDVEPLGGADIEAEAFLVDIGVVEIARGIEIDLEMLRCGRARQPAALVLRPFDLDDFGAKRAQPARRPGPRPHPAKIDNAGT